MTKRTTLVGVTLGAVGCAALAVLAGDLNPPVGGVSPTHKTLTEVEPRIPIHQSDIPLTISTPGSYYFAEHIYAIGFGSPVIRVVADDVAIDLRGFTLYGATEVSIASDGIQYDGGANNLVVENGTIRDCGERGIGFKVGTDGTGVFRNLQILHNVDDGIDMSGSFIRVTDCTIIGNEGNGVAATSVLMRNCFVQGNGNLGVVAFGGLVQSNVVVGNGGGNITLLGGTAIENEAP